MLRRVLICSMFGRVWPLLSRSSSSKLLSTTTTTVMSSAARGKTRRHAKPPAGPESEKYRETVLLPSTDFSQRANSAEREPQLQRYWEEHRVYQRLAESARASGVGERFTLHDGPPYANGDLHMGHALNKILKDFVNRFHILKGDEVRYVPGWDCHGLPIELKVLQAINAAAKKAKQKPERLEPLALRQRAAAFAKETVEKQRESFKRFGVWADWETPYLTLQPEYEAAQLGVFATMYERGHIYRGLKPVWYSPSSRTALAEAELEYPDGHVSPSAYVGLKVLDGAPCLPKDDDGEKKNIELAIWTTTPWTLPANLAVAVGEKIDYSLVEAKQTAGGEGGALDGRRFVIATDLVGSMGFKLKCEFETVGASFKGADLAAGTTYERPVANQESPVASVVLGGDYITAEGGTGLVHTAPGHGADDYATGLKYGLPPFSPVDAAGRFTEEAGLGLEGLSVMTGEGGRQVEKDLGSRLLLSEPYPHRYPYDWRTKKPVIQRATSQWFASVAGFRDEAMNAIENEVRWLPEVGKNRIGSMTSKRGDWCISRQRTWGVPLPVFYRKDDGSPLVTEETLKHVQEVVREHGSDAWFAMSVEDLLPPGSDLRERHADYDKGMDTMDVWFDSGTSWAGVLSARPESLKFPADVYLEGSDQHRGWFQSSLLTSIACNGVAPYKTVLTHGFVLDEAGSKMSKSLGNVVDPSKIILGGANQKTEPAYGADVMRLWVASVDYSSDVRIGANALKQVQEQYRKIRNTLRYMVGNVDQNSLKVEVVVQQQGEEGGQKKKGGGGGDSVAYAALPSLDKWLLGRLALTEGQVFEAYSDFAFARASAALSNFVNTDLSAFYLDVAKDRLYVSPADSKRRAQCQAVLVACLDALPRMMAPLLPHLAEELWHALPYNIQGEPYSAERGSVFELGGAPWVAGATLAPFPTLGPEEAATWAAVRDLRDDTNRALERARADKLVGASLSAQVLIAWPTTAAEGGSSSSSSPANYNNNYQLKKALDPLFLTRGYDLPSTFKPHAKMIGSDDDDSSESTTTNDVDDLRLLLLVSQVRFVADAEAVYAECNVAHVVSAEDSATGATVGVMPASTKRCARCWYHDETVGGGASAATSGGLLHPLLCARCEDAVQGFDFPPPPPPPPSSAAAAPGSSSEREALASSS